MIGDIVDRSATGQFRSQLAEEVRARKDNILTSRNFERDAGFIQGLEAALAVMDNIIQNRNNEHAKRTQQDQLNG